MSAQSKGGENALATKSAPVILQVLVQEILRQLANAGPSPVVLELDGETQENILLDIEVDGARYLLLRSPANAAASQVRLSPREQDIARMVAKGYSNKTIAAILEISSWTVSTHLRRIFTKLSVRSRAAMVARLLEGGVNETRPELSEWAAITHRERAPGK